MGHSPRDTLRVSQVRFSPSTSVDREAGMLGWLSLVLNDAIKFDGISLRRTRDGRLTLSYPVRRDRLGNEHSIVMPLDDEVRVEIERQVFLALGAEVAQ